MYREDISLAISVKPEHANGRFRGRTRMRWRGLEPPRGINPTRPSTLRVYQFRHQRAPAIVATPSVPSRRALRYGAVRELCEHAVAAALGAGASYADARVVVRRSQVVGTRNGRVERLDDQETEGIGVRVLVGGAWGFACDRRLDQEGAEAAARKAAAFAKAAPGGAQPRARAARAGARRVPHAVRARPVRGPGRREGRPLPARRAGARARGREGHLGLGPRAARAQGLRLLRRRVGRARAGRVRRRDRRDGRARRGRRRSAATRAPTAARARRPAGSTSSRSASSARRRASASRRPSCCAPSRARRA